MSKVSVRLVVLFLLSILILGVFILKFAGGLSQKVVTAKTVGMPLVLNQENDLINSSITQVLETKDAIFLVYGYKSIVQAYTLEGTYLYTVSVYDYLNGRTEVAYSESEDVLYISDKHLNMYAFSGHDFLEFIDKSHSWDLYTQLGFGRSSPNYKVEAGSVWHINGEEARCVVQKPIWQSFYQSNVLDLVLLLLLFLIGIILRFPHLTKRSGV